MSQKKDDGNRNRFLFGMGFKVKLLWMIISKIVVDTIKSTNVQGLQGMKHHSLLWFTTYFESQNFNHQSLLVYCAYVGTGFQLFSMRPQRFFGSIPYARNQQREWLDPITPTHDPPKHLPFWVGEMESAVVSTHPTKNIHQIGNYSPIFRVNIKTHTLNISYILT